MWRISYLNISDNKVKQKGGFNSDKEAIEWMTKEEKQGNICGLKLFVWSELMQCYRVVEDFLEY